MINLKRFDFDVRKYIHFLEELVIASLNDFNIESHRWKQAIGVWTYKNNPKYSSKNLPHYKIASIGVRVRHKIAFHGIAVNIFTNLSNFSGIIPCGIKNAKVTSVLDHGHRIELSDFDTALKSNFYKLLK